MFSKANLVEKWSCISCLKVNNGLARKAKGHLIKFLITDIKLQEMVETGQECCHGIVTRK